MTEQKNEKREVGLIEAADNALKNRVGYLLRRQNNFCNFLFLDSVKRANVEVYRKKERDVFDVDDNRLEKRVD